ncbi:ribosomal protein l6e domain-containing protein [Ditylenchus destructor]|nr:ribosomal protein l6e domain-containing protein [Ditylenchus destructor]
MPKAAKKGVRMPRNHEIAPGLMRFSSARMFHKRGLFEKLKKPFPKKTVQAQPKQETVTKKIGGDKNGGQRVVLAKKEPKFLAVVPKTERVHRKSKKAPLRKSITPGTVLIILVGRHRGKRVVFLKQLEKSGLLLVTGPLKLNATPMRRVAQAFVIATKTKLDIGGLEVPEHINDDYFKKVTKQSDKSKDGIFASGEKEEYVVSDQRKEDQKRVDTVIVDAIRKHPEKKFVFGYLGSRFSLGKNELPHNMVF